MKNTYVALLVMLSISVLAQEQSISYFDKKWQEVPRKVDAFYSRQIEMSGSLYRVRDYYVANDQLKMEATCSSISPSLVLEGKCSYYYESGQLEREGVYIKHKEVGLWKSYYETGQEKGQVRYDEEGHAFYLQRWDPDGKPLLVNGTGMFTDRSFNDLIQTYEVYDSLLIASFTVDPISGDSIFIVVEKSAEYRNGMEALYKGVGSMVRYPKEARKNGIQGKVYIEFCVDKDGVVRDAKVLKGIGGGCDEMALQALIKQKDWIPAKHHNKPVTQRMVLPVAFRL